MSRFAKSETRVQFLTDGAGEAEQSKAEEGTDASNAILEQVGAEIELRRAALHACVFDLGIVMRTMGTEGPEVEHVPAWELMFDAADAHRGKPSIRVRRFPADREALVSRFIAPRVELASKIEDPAERQRALDAIEEDLQKLRGGGTALTTPDHTQTEQHVIVYSLWRDPVGKKAGRYVVVTESVLLGDCEIPVDTLKNSPFTFFGFSAPLVGAYPESIAAIVSELQAEIDGMKTRKSQILRLLAVPRYLVTGPDGAQVETQVQGGSGALGDIVKVPMGTTVTPMNLGLAESLTAVTNEMNESWAKGFEMVGINPSNAMGSRPNGLNSAPAQREWNEIAQDRLSLVALEYQQAHVDLAEGLLDDIADMDGLEVSVKSPNGRFLKKVKMADLNLRKSGFVIQKFPIGALPTTPTGKLAAAGDLLQMGGIDKEQFEQIVDLPDLKSRVNINLSSRRATEKLVGKMLATGEPIAPPDCLEPTYALKYVTAKWLDGTSEDMAQDRLDLLQMWMDYYTSKQAAASGPAAPGVPGAAPGPDGVAPVVGAGRVGGDAVPLQPAGIAPLQNHEFAPPPGPMGAQ